VARTPNYFGLAISDAYLASAHPLPSVTSLTDLEEICCEEKMGGLTLALPLVELTPNAFLAEKLRQNLCHRFQHDDGLNAKVPLLTTIDETFRLADAKEAALDQVELWEAVDWDDKSPSTDAAIALNHFLWTHTGGWRNTFG
jgi:hypothetical protein